MVTETETRTYGSVAEVTAENPKFNRKDIIKLCLELYNEQNSSIDKRSSIKSDYDLENWLEKKHAESVKGISNLDFLVNMLYPGSTDRKVRMEVSRWLNQNLPR